MVTVTTFLTITEKTEDEKGELEQTVKTKEHSNCLLVSPRQYGQSRKERASL